MNEIKTTCLHEVTTVELVKTKEFDRDGSRIIKIMIDGGALVPGGHDVNLFLSDKSNGLVELVNADEFI